MRILNTLALFIFIGFAGAGYSATSVVNTSVPHKINFQSVFYDTGGNSLASGTYPAKFSILDQSDKPVYAEEQKIDLVNGVASVMVGDGFKPGSNYATSTGGIPADVLNPTQNYFLKVDLDGASQISPFQIVTVPFSYYSEKSLSVAPGGVLAESLAQGIIEKSHLSPDLQNAIFGGLSSDRLPVTVVSKQDFLSHVNAVANAHPAEAISVTNPAFANSRSTNVGGVLKDLDVAIEYRKHDIQNVQSQAITNTSNIQTLQGQVTINTNNIQTVLSQTTTNTNNIQTLQSQLVSDVNNLQGKVLDNFNTLQSSINTNANNLQSQISDNLSTLQNAVNTKLSLSGGNLSGTLDLGNNKITGVADPSNAQDVATKAYVDSKISPSISPSPSTAPQIVAAGYICNQQLISSFGISRMVTAGQLRNSPEGFPDTFSDNNLVFYFSSPTAYPYYFQTTRSIADCSDSTVDQYIPGGLPQAPVIERMYSTRFVTSPSTTYGFSFVIYK